MSEFEIGMLAKSKAGHDKNKIYVITGVDESYVYVADGKTKKLAGPKRKKRIHLQLICRRYDITAAADETIRKIISENA